MPLVSAAAPVAVGEFPGFVDGTRAANAMGADHDYAAEGVTKLAAALAAVARQGGAGADEVRRAAEAVQPDRPLLDQRSRVQAFFEQAGGALRGPPGTR